MRKVNILLVACVLGAFAFQGCSCDEAVKKAQTEFDSKLTAVSDSLAGAAKTELDAAKATYGAQIQALTDSLAAKTAALEAAVAKKTGTTTKKTTTTTKQEPAKTTTTTPQEQKKETVKKVF